MPGTDFDGDGRDDILWRDVNSGRVSNWLATEDGGWTVNDSNALTAPVSMDFVTTGDFDADGRDDVLWRAGNEIYLAPTGVDGGFDFHLGAGFVANVSSDWEIVGTGDFNGDGFDDILWRNSDGRVSNWLANPDNLFGFIINDANAMTSSLADWPIWGIGDFNGDGNDDIVTRFGSGVWNLSLGTDSGAFVHEDPFADVGGGWFVAGVGDFNGDGQDDLLWRNADTGAVSNWLFAGGLGAATFTINDANALVGVPTDWHIVGVGDYDGDGHDDILWRNENGTLSNWLATVSGGWAINDVNALSGVPNDWVVQPFAVNASGVGFWDY